MSPCARALPRRIILPAILAILAISLPAAASPEDAPRVVNGAEPRDGVRTLDLVEQWRRGGDDDDEVMFGVPEAATIADDGTIYVMDTQLATAHVFGPDGEFLGNVGREGEGPGELREPNAIFMSPGGDVCFLDRMPGTMVTVTRGGDPAGSTRLSLVDTDEGGMVSAVSGFYRNGRIAVSGHVFSGFETSDGITMLHFLGLFDPSGAEIRRLADKTRKLDINRRRFVEREDFSFAFGGLWAMGPDGRCYLAADRDRYAIEVYSLEGELEKIIERPYQGRERTKQEKEDIAAGVRVIVDGQRMEIECEIEDREPCINFLHVAENGELWALGSVGSRPAEEGVYQIWDVFDPDGTFLRQVKLMCPGDPDRDRMLRVSDDVFLVIQGFEGVGDSMYGGGDEGDGEDAEEQVPLEVICYRAR